MQITTFLMFSGRAQEAMTFYMSLFDDSRVVSMTCYGPNEAGKEGTIQHATFELNGQQFMCIDSPVTHPFTFTAAMSLFVSCTEQQEIESLFAALSDNGSVLMPLQAYPFARLFAWVQDRFGVSWQLKLA